MEQSKSEAHTNDSTTETTPRASLTEKLLELGNLFGQIGALITFPAVIIAFFVFWQEIGDVLSTPEFEVVSQTVELRCAVRLSSNEAIERSRASFGDVCGQAPLALSLALTLKNLDSIPRTVQSVSGELKIEALEGLREGIKLELVHDVEHRVENYVEAHTLLPWREKAFAAGQVRVMELQFDPLLNEQARDFVVLRDALRAESSILAGKTATVTINATYASDLVSPPLIKCIITFEPSSLARFRERHVDAIAAYSRRCTRLEA